MIKTAISRSARVVLSSFPLHHGKWQLWRMYKYIFDWVDFSPGAYRTKHGFQLFLKNERYIEKFVYYWGEWEGNETYILNKLLRNGGVFIDIGANIGYFTCLAATRVGATGQVYAFEPVPETFSSLVANINLNKFNNVQAHQIAASNKKETMLLAKPNNPGALEMVTTRNASAASPHWEVHTERVDSIIDPNLNVDLVKIDIEGAEMFALKGLESLLSKDRAPIVLCEVNDAFLKDTGHSADELLKYMRDLGYSHIYCFKHKKLFPCIRDNSNHSSLQENLLFSKNSLIADI